MELDGHEQRALRRKVRLGTLEALHALGGDGRRRTINEHVVRFGGFSERELAAPAPAKHADKHPTRLDYELAWALTNLKRDGLVENPARGVWRLAEAVAAPAPPLAAPVMADRLTQLKTMPYREYLRSPEWRETRGAALVRAGHACSLDATHVDRLEVHHRTYDRLGEERPEDVIVLCHDCHRHHHRLVGRPRKQEPPRPSVPPPGACAVEPVAVPDAPSPSPRRSLLRRLLSV